MQTILGAGGPIGIELAKALTKYTNKIRLVSRNPEKVNPSDELFPADILDPAQLEKVVKGSEVVYVTVGFPYNYKTWKKSWPPFINNLIRICKEQQCKLVFFDNVYIYDKEHLDGMTEKTPVNPPSKKGAIRAEIAGQIMKETEKGKLQALIARSADFYGPDLKTNNSILTETVFKPLSQGKTANWLGSDKFRHSFTYTVDAGKATALLGNTSKAYGQVWHLPTAPKPFTGQEWVENIAAEMDAKPKYRIVSKFMVKILGLFMSVMRESVEMMYQYDRNYVFDSSKFEREFNFKPTPYSKGIKEVINSLK